MIHQRNFETFRRTAAFDTNFLVIFLHGVTLVINTHQTITATQTPAFGNVHADTRKALEKFPHLMKRNFILTVQMQTRNFIASTDTAPTYAVKYLFNGTSSVKLTAPNG